MGRSAYALDTGADIHWLTQAACRHHDPDWWTVASKADRTGREGNRRARAICATCPVRDQCGQLLGTDDAPPGTIVAGVDVPWTARPYQRHHTITLQCGHCHHAFQATSSRQTYCARRCQQAARRVRVKHTQPAGLVA